MNTSAVARPASSSRVSRANIGQADAKKAGSRLSATTPTSVSAHRRSSVTKTTASIVAKRSEVECGHEKTVIESASNLAASLTSKITKLVKGGSQPVAAKTESAAASSKTNRRMSLESNAQPRTGLMTSSTGVMTSRSRDNNVSGGWKTLSKPELSQSMTAGEGRSVTGATRGASAGRNQTRSGFMQRAKGTGLPPVSLAKSSSTISLRHETAKKNSVDIKSVSCDFSFFSPDNRYK